MSNLDAELKHPLNSRMFTCPVQGRWTSFQLVDESGEGLPYAGLAYEVIDTEGHFHKGALDSTGTGKVENHFAGPVALIIKEQYRGGKDFYEYLLERPHYPLPITELKVRAEQTRYFHRDGSRIQNNLEFLLVQSLKETDDTLAKRWQARPDETPAAHFERVYQATQFWQGDAPL